MNEDGDPGDDGEHHEGDPQQRQHDDVRDQQEPLHQPEPPAQRTVQVALEVHRLGAPWPPRPRRAARAHRAEHQQHGADDREERRRRRAARSLRGGATSPSRPRTRRATRRVSRRRSWPPRPTRPTRAPTPGSACPSPRRSRPRSPGRAGRRRRRLARHEVVGDPEGVGVDVRDLGVRDAVEVAVTSSSGPIPMNIGVSRLGGDRQPDGGEVAEIESPPGAPGPRRGRPSRR